MKLRSRVGLLLVLVLAVMGISLTPGVRAEDPRAGGIHGVVVARGDSGPVNVAGAGVFLLRAGTDRVVASTRSGRNGEFSFRGVRPGSYVVGASKDRVGRGREGVEVTAGSVSRVRIGLVGR